MKGRRFSKQRKDLVVAIITIFSVYIEINDFVCHSSFGSNGKLSARDILGCAQYLYGTVGDNI